MKHGELVQRLDNKDRERICALRRSKKLHASTQQALIDAIGKLFPSWVAIPEVAQTPGGRNDLILFEGNGQSICFEIFASAVVAIFPSKNCDGSGAEGRRASRDAVSGVTAFR